MQLEVVWFLLTFVRRRQWHLTPILSPGKSHGWNSLVGCSPWGRWESGTTEWLHFHFSLSCIGGGNGNPLQCSCLENPWNRGAWWAAVYGVTQSRTRLKWLSSSSSSNLCNTYKGRNIKKNKSKWSKCLLFSSLLYLCRMFYDNFKLGVGEWRRFPNRCELIWGHLIICLLSRGCLQSSDHFNCSEQI